MLIEDVVLIIKRQQLDHILCYLMEAFETILFVIVMGLQLDYNHSIVYTYYYL